MSDPTPHDSPHEDPVAEDASPLRVAMGFFIVPLLVVVGAVAVFLLFGLIAHEGKDPTEYLTEISGRGINEPWQAAFHLSQVLAQDESLRGDEQFAGRLARTLDDDGAEDPRVRRYVAVALGRVGHSAAVPALVNLLIDEDAEARANATWALGRIGDSTAAAQVAGRLDDEDPEVRTMAAYVLGVFRASSTTERLVAALGDPHRAVRWNAAVSLGLMGEVAGVVVLERMIDRDHLGSVEGLTPQETQQAMLAALRALEQLNPTPLRTRLEVLRDSDPDLRIREAARRALRPPETGPS